MLGRTVGVAPVSAGSVTTRISSSKVHSGSAFPSPDASLLRSKAIAADRFFQSEGLCGKTSRPGFVGGTTRSPGERRDTPPSSSRQAAWETGRGAGIGPSGPGCSRDRSSFWTLTRSFSFWRHSLRCRLASLRRVSGGKRRSHTSHQRPSIRPTVRDILCNEERKRLPKYTLI